jgi:DNA replication protein DnaC
MKDVVHIVIQFFTRKVKKMTKKKVEAEPPKTWEHIIERNDRFRRMAKFSGMPVSTYFSNRLYNFLPGQGTYNAHQAALAFIREERRQHHFLTFGGDTGLGKTHLALGIGWHFLEHDYGIVKYWSVSELLDAMRNEYEKPPMSEHGIPLKGQFDLCKEVELLILDDVGAEKQTEWAADKLDQLINYRWLNDKLTVFTTNLVFSQLPNRTASRLKEGVTVLLQGADYRETKARRRKVKNEPESNTVS